MLYRIIYGLVPLLTLVSGCSSPQTAGPRSISVPADSSINYHNQAEFNAPHQSEGIGFVRFNPLISKYDVAIGDRLRSQIPSMTRYTKAHVYQRDQDTLLVIRGATAGCETAQWVAHVEKQAINIQPLPTCMPYVIPKFDNTAGNILFQPSDQRQNTYLYRIATHAFVAADELKPTRRKVAGKSVAHNASNAQPVVATPAVKKVNQYQVGTIKLENVDDSAAKTGTVTWEH